MVINPIVVLGLHLGQNHQCVTILFTVRADQHCVGVMDIAS